MKNEWCEHVIWRERNGDPRWVFNFTKFMPDQWIYCPFCGTPKPEPIKDEDKWNEAFEWL